METLHPGSYLIEVKGEVPVEGLSTSTGAFVGTAQKGEIGKAHLVTSWSQFVSLYGSFDDNSYLAYAVRGFFENGGTRAFISRVVKTDNGVNASNPASVTVGPQATPHVEFTAITDGTWGDSLSVEIASVTSSSTFNLFVKENGAVVEKFEGTHLSLLEDINSKYISALVFDEDAVPVAGSYRLVGGDNGILGIQGSDYIGDAAKKTGIYAFDGKPINLVAIPGITDVSVVKSLESYVDGRKDCFAIVEVPFAKGVMDAVKYKTVDANLSSPNLALYYPWLVISDPIGVGANPTKVVPPSGHIMGVFARTDNERGVFKTPAGVDAVVRGAIGLENTVEDADQDLLNPIGVNCVRSFAGQGIIVWGGRTAQQNGEFRYISARRSAIYVGQSIVASSRWAVFENNDDVLWSKLRTSIEGFLRGFWRQGGLKGKDESQAFFVQVDESTTTQEDIDAGKVYANYGLAVQKPAEFVVFRASLRK